MYNELSLSEASAIKSKFQTSNDGSEYEMTAAYGKTS